ncbi:hypothetical protein CSQ85_01670 [Bifidobacterium rousetti]|uniref:reverse transcriptase domain-containing protein n=1 Tax=Bifidobacterium rousetti TaxID=2045439 RepID=UPI0012393831|nr:reverse transcriptase domain-containing protein [Bifidobacterium rousetti]KAA8820514.1 hypothetical protein CSQ85_01670 [Bifidobacterium rousetti]
MSNEDRRRARRQRREAKRAANRAKRTKQCTIESIADLNTLEQAAFAAASGVSWKASTQSYMLHRLPRIVEARRKLLAGEDVTLPRRYFDLWERGKLRHIQAARFPERVIQKALSRQVLLPVYTPTFTSGNSANTRGRGTMYAIRRLKRQLARHYRRHGRDGWILLCDYRNYFGSIPRELVLEQAARLIDDPRVLALIRRMLDRERGDYGLGLGAEQNQILAVAYPSRIDHWLEEMSGCEATGRYMDDVYVIDNDRDRLRDVLRMIEYLSWRLGLTLNPKKTRLVKLSHGFTFLKRKWSITDSGRIVVRPARKGITHERRKLKRMARLAGRGILTTAAFERSYMSWRGGLDHVNGRRSQRTMDVLYRRLLDEIQDEREAQ